MDFVDGADLPLLFNQYAGLQVDHALRITDGLLRRGRALLLQGNTRIKPPPDYSRTERNQQPRPQCPSSQPPREAAHTSTSRARRQSFTRSSRPFRPPLITLVIFANSPTSASSLRP